MPETTWEDRLRMACRDWSGTLYQLAKAAEMDERQLRRFVAGEQSIGIATAEKIGRVVGLELIAAKRRAKKG
jgi:plasmid maintenance system antidote protein VapI